MEEEKVDEQIKEDKPGKVIEIGNRLTEWVCSLPIWAELDNYLYFLIAIYVLNMGEGKVDEKVFYGFMGSIIGAALMKGKGK